MARLLLIAIAAAVLLAGCRDEEKVNLKAENHRLQRELKLAKNRIGELEGELKTANLLYAPPPLAPMDPNATSTGGVGQRGPVTGPPVAAAVAQYRRPYRGSRAPLRALPTAAPAGLPAPIQTGQALSLAPEPAPPPPPQLVPMSPEQLEALQGSGG